MLPKQVKHEMKEEKHTKVEATYLGSCHRIFFRQKELQLENSSYRLRRKQNYW
jgi:hypothetical protein